jgi:hypothetical protein
MSDDDFGDFAEAVEDAKIDTEEIELDNCGRPIDYLKSVRISTD